MSNEVTTCNLITALEILDWMTKNPVQLLDYSVLTPEHKHFMKDRQITAVQFEDGSGYKFNFQIDGKPNWIFIDFSEYVLTGFYSSH